MTTLTIDEEFDFQVGDIIAVMDAPADRMVEWGVVG